MAPVAQLLPSPQPIAPKEDAQERAAVQEIELNFGYHSSDKKTLPPTTQQRPNQKTQSKVTRCEHTDANYYAQGLCRNCYHSKGRLKLATDCEHSDRKLYARGVCKACYLRLFQYNKSTMAKKTATAKKDKSA